MRCFRERLRLCPVNSRRLCGLDGEAILTRQSRYRIRCFDYAAKQQYRHFPNMLTTPEEKLYAELPLLYVQAFVIDALSDRNRRDLQQLLFLAGDRDFIFPAFSA